MGNPILAKRPQNAGALLKNELCRIRELAEFCYWVYWITWKNTIHEPPGIPEKMKIAIKGPKTGLQRSESQPDVRNLGRPFEFLDGSNMKSVIQGRKTGFQNLSSKQTWSCEYEYKYSGVENMENIQELPKMIQIIFQKVPVESQISDFLYF